MKTILAFLVMTSCAFTLLAAESGGIEYIQTAYPIYKLTGGNAAMLSEIYLAKTRTIQAEAAIDAAQLSKDELGATLPEERTKYAADMGERFALVLKGPKEVKFNLSFQDIAYLKTDKGKHPLMVLAYKGCPFSVKQLAGSSDLSLREPLTVEITSIKDNVLYLKDDSTLPFIVTSESTTPCFTAVNVQWRFAQAGMTFSTDKHTYKTEKEGATISFTDKGLKLDGVTQTPKAKK